jgi:hypothetical protein
MVPVAIHKQTALNSIMRIQNRASAWVHLRALGASATGLLGAIGAATALLRWGRPGVTASTTPEEVVSEWILWAALVLCGWLALGSLLSVGATLPGTLGAICADLARRLTPKLLRQAIAATLGTTVATLSLPMAAAQGAGIVRDVGAAGVGDSVPPGAPPRTSASPEPGPEFGPTRRSTHAVARSTTAQDTAPAPIRASAAPDPGWAPSPPVRVVPADESRLVARPPRPSASPEAAVTVHRGDTLWHIAARHLGPGASDAEIALEWPRWYAANSLLIGADPDRLLPGQQLQPPVPGGLR